LDEYRPTAGESAEGEDIEGSGSRVSSMVAGSAFATATAVSVSSTRAEPMRRELDAESSRMFNPKSVRSDRRAGLQFRWSF
jgi:hypothetical protein